MCDIYFERILRNPVAWDAEDYYELERKFQSLSGVPRGSTTVAFEKVGSRVDVDQFKKILEALVERKLRNQIDENTS